MTWLAREQLIQKRETKCEAAVFPNLISEASFHHFCHVLLVTQIILATGCVCVGGGCVGGAGGSVATLECECPEVGIMATTSSKNYTIFTSFPKVLCQWTPFHPSNSVSDPGQPAQSLSLHSATPDPSFPGVPPSSAVPAVQALVLLGHSEQNCALLGGWVRNHCLSAFQVSDYRHELSVSPYYPWSENLCEGVLGQSPFPDG